ncbi:MAG TPA: hypothetical protein VIE43_02865 [Thermoanaerobaculia bacterium]|nr:hypothetical protein [Thermoanaerobaculia bacterium]
MKKDLTARKMQKLQLSRETLCTLKTTDLQVAVGGVTLLPCTNNCTGKGTCFC